LREKLIDEINQSEKYFEDFYSTLPELEKEANELQKKERLIL